MRAGLKMELWSGQGSLHLLVVGIPLYVVVVLVLRVFGKRTLAKMSAFDLVVTIALGSVLGGSLLNGNVALGTAVLAVVLLVALQFAVSWLSLRSRRFLDIVRSEPALLYYGGRFLDDAMKSERITRDVVIAGMRSAGFLRFDQVHAVVLETDGSLSVMPREESGPQNLLSTVKNLDDANISASSTD